jgi:hypothetical protein
VPSAPEAAGSAAIASGSFRFDACLKRERLAKIDVSPAHRSVQRSLEQAMREAAWNLDNDFRTVSGVVRWLENHGAK